MNTKDLPAVCGFEPLVPGEEREIEGIFTGDLLAGPWAAPRKETPGSP